MYMSYKPLGLSLKSDNNRSLFDGRKMEAKTLFWFAKAILAEGAVF